jgi:two-component system, response regulator, stage 0 sporulation protein F
MCHILIVEDDLNQRELYEQELKDEGYNVSLAENGEQALDSLKRARPDLIILDICMPGMDGIELLSAILSIDRVMPVIINSAYSQYRDNYLTWPANAYVVKSGDLSDLKAKIVEQLELTGRT